MFSMFETTDSSSRIQICNSVEIISNSLMLVYSTFVALENETTALDKMVHSIEKNQFTCGNNFYFIINYTYITHICICFLLYINNFNNIISLETLDDYMHVQGATFFSSVKDLISGNSFEFA